MRRRAPAGEVRSVERVRTLGEVFTPAGTVNAMLDLLPAWVWDAHPSVTFLEPSCGTGNFLVAVLTRKLAAVDAAHTAGTLPAGPSVDGRVFHGLAALTSIYGVELSPENVLGETGARARLVEAFLRWCGATENEATRAEARGIVERNLILGDMLSDGRDSLPLSAYTFDPATRTWSHAPATLGAMPLGVILGNPPYQREDAGHGRSATPLYHAFVRHAVALGPGCVLMIVPSRWMAGGKGLDAFRDGMLRDRRLAVLVDHPDSRDVFPSVDIAGGVCELLWLRDHDGPCSVVSEWPGGRTTDVRELSEFDVVIRCPRALAIVRKVRARAQDSMRAMVSARKPYGLDTRARPTRDVNGATVTLRWQNGEGPLPRSAVTRGADTIDAWKVVASYAAFDHAGAPAPDGRRRVLSVVAILPPGTVCNETYLVIGAFDTQREAESLRSYMHTRFFRFLLSLRMCSQHLTRSVYEFVPQQRWDRPWTDEALYAAYGLDAQERAHIEAAIREMPAHPRVG